MISSEALVILHVEYGMGGDRTTPQLFQAIGAAIDCYAGRGAPVYYLSLNDTLPDMEKIPPEIGAYFPNLSFIPQAASPAEQALSVKQELLEQKIAHVAVGGVNRGVCVAEAHDLFTGEYVGPLHPRSEPLSSWIPERIERLMNARLDARILDELTDAIFE